MTLAALSPLLSAAPDEAADFAALQAALAEEPGREDYKTTEKAIAWDHAHALRVIRLAESYLADHPQSPRRRSAQLAIAGSIASADQIDDRQEHFRRFASLLEALLADSSLSDEEWRVAAGAQLEGRLTSLRHSPGSGTAEQWRTVEERLGEFSRRAGDGRRYAGLVSFYTHVLTESDPVRALDVLQELEKSPVERIARMAKAQLRVLRLVGQRAEFSFSALDGRAVDLAKLRGKVVLVDFWATWCGPCIAELPSIKKVYAAYHDHGFEVVGIALENARLNPADSTEQTAAKLAKARQILADFVAKEQIPWPQHFDGKWWKNDFAVKYGISSIPAMFLVDQNGKIVTTSARGEKLETEVKRLLGL